MAAVIDMFSGRLIKAEQNNRNKSDKLDNEYKAKTVGKMGLEEAISQVYSAAAMLAIECDLDSFDYYVAELMKAVRHYKYLKKKRT